MEEILVPGAVRHQEATAAGVVTHVSWVDICLGFEHVQWFKADDSVTRLHLSRVKVTEQEWCDLMEALETHPALNTLIVKRVELTDAGGFAIARLLERNSRIKSLDVCGTWLRCSVRKRLFRAALHLHHLRDGEYPSIMAHAALIMRSTQLRHLTLRRFLCESCASFKPLVKALRQNTSLRTLDLSGLNFPEEVTPMLVSALEHNVTLTDVLPANDAHGKIERALTRNRNIRLAVRSAILVLRCVQMRRLRQGKDVFLHVLFPMMWNAAYFRAWHESDLKNSRTKIRNL